MILANILEIHKSSRIATWHSPEGKTNNQIDYIIMKRRFNSCINMAKTRVYNKADIGSDHDLVMVSFKQKDGLNTAKNYIIMCPKETQMFYKRKMNSMKKKKEMIVF